MVGGHYPFAIGISPAHGCQRLTLLKDRQPGRPRSRANDQVILEELARAAMMEQKASAVTMLTMAVDPAFDAVA